ncbi:hypothetical protein AOXY_G2304 [Acipenser oxyrinchus oxyrinchus]|uniref:Uncharacterized protein n=1 Tax=Acipenser oxyrinchus oxyrinchus TaxID=40147 RepID=A0AAD8GHK3_ACIOX|nr:hypothetical protein AOXY_G2304 [Acipenser oxyrinchus oxyrinchus]
MMDKLQALEIFPLLLLGKRLPEERVHGRGFGVPPLSEIQQELEMVGTMKSLYKRLLKREEGGPSKVDALLFVWEDVERQLGTPGIPTPKISRIINSPAHTFLFELFYCGLT